MTLLRSCTAAALVLLTAVACHRQPTADSASRFAPTPPTIDGHDNDWENDLLVYDATSKLQYRIANDARTVYVRLKAADQATQARIITQGLTVWLDTTGRNQQQFGVRYPLGAPRGTRPNALPPNAGGPSPDGREERLARLLAGMHEMELLNYKGSKEPTLTDTQSQLGVQAAAAFDAQDNLIYELAVPLRLLYHHVPAINGKQPLVVGVTFAGAKPPTAGSSGSRGGGNMGGGMRGGGMGGGGMRGGGMRGGGMRGGGMGGGGMRGSMGGRPGGGMQQSSYSKPLSLKTNVQLSAK